jgi:hypothetical protein
MHDHDDRETLSTQRRASAQRLARITEATASGYRNAGYVENSRGRLMKPPPASTARPLGLSRYPKPKRSAMATNRRPLLAAEVATLASVASPDRSLYQSDGAGYRLSHSGRLLKKYRELAAENAGDVPALHKVYDVDREGWYQLIAVAEPEARAYLLRMAASKIIRIAR